jgi:hypothetical protein
MPRRLRFGEALQAHPDRARPGALSNAGFSVAGNTEIAAEYA